MFFTYEESVLAAADDLGNLSERDALTLLREHGFTLLSLAQDTHGIDFTGLEVFNAEALLAWLGY